MTLDPANIRQLTPDDFDQLYEIWEEGSPVAFSNANLDLKHKADFYQAFFKKALASQTEAFRYWGYFDGDILVAWHSLLPCQAAPVLYHLYAETSLYIRRGYRSNGLGVFLMKFCFDYARQHSELAYILGTNSALSEKSHSMLREVGFTEIGDIPRSARDKTWGENDNGRVWFYVM